MRVVLGNGVEVHDGSRTLFLDPKRTIEGSVVTHGHSDHLTPDGHMTPPTLDFLRIRKPARSGRALSYDTPAAVNGYTITLRDAGHILGSAMVEVQGSTGTLLYTGDFNTRPSTTNTGARPRECDTLVMESTYGDPRSDLPPRALTLANLEQWMLTRMLRGPVALGAYPLGRAQELVALANQAGVTPIVSPEIGALTAVYNAHGHDLAYAVSGTERARDLEAQGGLHIVSREWLKKGHDFARGLRARKGAAAYLSGWCHRYSYFNGFDIDAQFALSDHASFSELVEFASASKAKQIYTMHGADVMLAKELRQRGMRASPLEKIVA